MKKFVILFLLPLILWSCTSDKEGPTPVVDEEEPKVEEIIAEFAQPVETVSTLELSDAQTAAISGYNELGWKIFETVYDENPESNHSISPVSINSALSLFASIADESEARKQLVKCLGFDNVEELDNFNQQLVSFLPSSENGVDLSLANSLWVSDHYSLNQEIVKTLATKFGATVESVDFSNPKTVALINAWINDYTRGKIPSMLDNLTPIDGMCIANALYFKGDWENSFNKAKNQEGKFRKLQQNESKVTYMRRLDELEYSESMNFSMASLPFKGKKVVMDLILPFDQKNKLSFEEYTTLYSNASLDSVNLTMPKFEFDPNYGAIDNALTKIGLPMTSHGLSNLGLGSSGICSIGQIMHQMHIGVSETGAEAAAASVTTWVTGNSGDPSPYQFLTLSEPFYFVIREVEHNIILAIGHVADPALN